MYLHSKGDSEYVHFRLLLLLTSGSRGDRISRFVLRSMEGDSQNVQDSLGKSLGNYF